MRVLSLSCFLLALVLCACSEAPSKNVETRILCVWDAAELEFGNAVFPVGQVTPNLAAWRAEGHVQEHARGRTPSASSAFASLLTALPLEEHGLRSVTEVGAARLRSNVMTRAQALPPGTQSLASVSRWHFGLQGLSQGIGQWLSPDQKNQWSAREVWQAVETPMDRALAGDSAVFLVLHFSDMGDGSWKDAQPSQELLATGLAAWRGKGGLIDEAFAAEDQEQSLATRLATKLLRRKDDPRKEALERCFQAAALHQLDGILGKLREQLTRHGRLDGARLELDFGANPASSLPRGQSVRVTGQGEFASLTTKLVLEGGESKDLRADQALEMDRRGSAFALQFNHPRLFSIKVDSLLLGEQTLGQADVPALLARHSDPWPENAFVGPLLEFNKAGGRELSGRVDAPAGAEVELLLTSFPVSADWVRGVQAPDAQVTAHGTQPGVARIVGSGPVSFSLPLPAPSARLGALLRVDGTRVSGSRMSYLGRLFVNSDRLDLCFASTSWIDAGLRGPGEAPESAAIHVQLLDRVALLPGVELFSPEERALLGGLHENE